MIRRHQLFLAPDGDAPGPTFAEAALKAIKTDPDAPTPADTATPTPEKKETPTPDARRVPDELFGGKKQEAAETKTEAASEIDKLTDIQTTDKKVGDAWKALKAQGKAEEKRANELTAKATELEKRIAEFEAKGKDTEALQTKLAALEKQNSEYIELVRKVNVELTPEFQQSRARRNELVNGIKSLVGDAGGDGAAIESALRLKGSDQIKAVADVIGDLPTYVQGIIGAEIKELSQLDKTVDAARSNPEEYLATRQREEQERTSKERETMIRTAQLAFDHADKRLGSDLEVLRNVEGLEWWNKQAADIRQNARRKFEVEAASDPNVAAEVCIRAEAMTVYRDLFQDQRAENSKQASKIKELETELKKVYGTSPGLRAALPSSANGGKRPFFAEVAIDGMQGRGQ